MDGQVKLKMNVQNVVQKIEIENECPECGSKNIQRLRRVTGYLTGNYTTAFNIGKQHEVEDRFKHSKKL